MIYISIKTKGPNSLALEKLEVLSEDDSLIEYGPQKLPDLSRKPVIFFNAVFCLTVLEQMGCIITDFEDVRLMAKLAEVEISERLFTPVGKHYFQYTMEKKEQVNQGVNVRELKRLYQELSPVVNSPPYQREKAVIPAILNLQRSGFAFDMESWKKELLPKQQELARLKEELDYELGTDQRTAQAFTNKGVPLKDLSTRELKLHLDNRIVKLLYDERELLQYLHVFMESIEKAMHDGRLYCQWDSFAALSGRMTARRPNIQAMPKISRKHFKAEAGSLLIMADYSQIELRVLAEITKDTNLSEAFFNGGDIHLQTASRIFGKTEREVSQDQRAIAKTLNFGIVYGITAHGIQKNLSKKGISFTLKEAAHLRQEFLAIYPDVRRFQQKISTAKKVKTLGGRWIDVRALSVTQKMNLPVQGTAAEGFKEALILLHGQLQDHWNIVVAAHDEIVLEGPVADAEAAKLILQTAMKNGMKRLIRHIPITVEIKSSCSWGTDLTASQIVILNKSEREVH